MARTRVVPPPGTGAFLPRPRLRARLDGAAARPAAAVLAGAGFGKTTVLAEWAAGREGPTAWYSVAEGDDEEYLFLAYLVAALGEAGVAVGPAAALLEEGRAAARPVLDATLSALVDHPGLVLVVDDAHRLRSPEVLEGLGYLVRYLPPGVSVVLGARRVPEVADWRGWVLRGRAAEVGAADLALSEEEAAALLALRQGSPPGPERVREVLQRTGGWPLAVDVVARQGGEGVQLAGASAGLVDDLLAAEIWAEVAPDERDFLVRCSVLEILTPEACARVGRRADAGALLASLAAQGLFLHPLPEGSFRLHQLFGDFLRKRLAEDAGAAREAHREAARERLDRGEALEAVDHLLQAGDLEEAAAAVGAAGPALLARGRTTRFLGLLGRLREAGHEPGPELVLQEGHARRLAGDYGEALGAYHRAAEASDGPRLRGRALAGMARVYVDTVQPAPARELLRRAFRTLPPEAREERGAVLDLLAENAVNEGRAAGALRYRRWSRRLRAGAGSDRLDARILLRTGQLAAARSSLEARREARPETPDRPRELHREDALVLSYVAALQGDAAEAEARAREGLEAARAAGSRPTEAVAWMRLGHALQLGSGSGSGEEAGACYERAAGLVRETGVERLRAEVLMGQALLEAHRGDVPRSYACATEGLAITRTAGDAWLSAWLRLAAGISGTLGGHPGAGDLLEAATEELDRCRDAFGGRLARLWRALHRGEAVPEAARALAERGFSFVLERPTLFGPRREMPALAEPAAAEPLVRVQALGPFRLWRGGTEVEHRAWKRQKARELFLILLTQRGAFLQKEHLMDLLWPDATPAAANRDFRVALHALSEVLDPDRPRNESARWIARRDAAYSLEPGPDLVVDVDDFERLVRRAREAADPAESGRLLRTALALYRGDYLEDHPYSDWAAPERERLRALYVETAESAARAALERGDEEEAAEIAHGILARDRCWEEAWRLLMRLHLARGRAFLAARLYEQCAQALEEELGVEPAEETEELYRQAVG